MTLLMDTRVNISHRSATILAAFLQVNLKHPQEDDCCIAHTALEELIKQMASATRRREAQRAKQRAQG